MDPEVCLRELVAAAVAEDYRTVSQREAALRTWINGGGFLPPQLAGFGDQARIALGLILTAASMTASPRK